MWCALVLLVVDSWCNIPRDQADSAGMLAHLHAFFVDFDLLYDNEYQSLGVSPLFAFVTPEGVVSNHWPSGATWMQAPGYCLGLLAAHGLHRLGLASADPLGVVVLLSVRLWTMLMATAAGVVAGRWIARACGSRAAAAVTMWCFVLGTPILYYASESPLRPHAYGAIVSLTFVYLWNDRSTAASSTRPWLLGALAGLASCVRPQLAPLVLLAFEDALQVRPGRLRRVGVTVLGFLPWPLLLARIHVWMYGLDFADSAGEVSHHLGHFLGSPYRGLFVWCPVLAIAFVALLRSAILRERGAWIIAFIIALQLWLDGTTRSITPFEVLGTRTWTGGVAFGPRKFVDVLPLLLPATISLVQAARQRGWGTKLAVLAIALTIPTVAMHVAAFADPRATTGQVLDWSGYGHRIVAGLTLAGLHEAAAARSLPIAVGLVLGVFVGLPTAAAGILGYRRWSQLGGKHRGRVGATIVLGAAASAHVWTTVLLVRSDRLLAEDPQRMVAAARTFNPNHLATVQTIERHHAELRAKLGDSAAP